MWDLNKEITGDPIKEARRYVDNARDVLRKDGKLNTVTGRYEDSKYVKAAGNYLWSGVLIALDAVFHGMVIDGYHILHLSMTYDGVQRKKTCEDGFRLANEIIDQCERLLGEQAFMCLISLNYYGRKDCDRS